MLTNNKIKLIASLKQKKNRDTHGLFVCEGGKVVQEFLDSGFDIEEVYSTDLASFPNAVKVSVRDLSRITQLKNPNSVLGVVRIPKRTFHLDQLQGKITIAVDSLQDPGNLGTIIRIADWFGISNVICSKGSVDVYNPKVVQSTMGSLTRVGVYYEDLEDIISSTNVETYGAVLNGDNLYGIQKIAEAILVFGNESKGISPEVLSLLNHKLTIPRVGNAESLNAAVSVGIICSELFRKGL